MLSFSPIMLTLIACNCTRKLCIKRKAQPAPWVGQTVLNTYVHWIVDELSLFSRMISLTVAFK